MNAKLSSGLITSYSLMGELFSDRPDALSPFLGENSPVYAELYFLMLDDVANCRRFLGIPAENGQSAVSFLASLQQDQIERVGQRILALTQSHHIDPIALATFIPEILASRPVQRQAFSAIENTLRIAEVVGRGVGHRVLVEMVAGSRVRRIKIDGVWDFQTPPDGNVVAELMTSEEAEYKLVDCLKQIKNRFFSNRAYDTDDKLMPRLALELEPGDLYVLNDWSSIQRISHAVAESDLAGFVGFNLDIAHWYLARVPHAIVCKNRELRDQIFHAHIAGHSRRGHFCDLPLDRVSRQTEQEYSTWLRFLRSGLPNYSGCVSLELEAARSDDEVKASISKLTKWIN